MQTNDRNYSSIPPKPASTPSVPSTQTDASIPLTSSIPTQGIDDFTVQLLEERLNVERRRQKIGEIVVRREIETRIIEVPVRREKLIVEQVSPEFRQIASIDVGSTEDGSPSPLTQDPRSDQRLQVSYATIQDASRALQMMASELGNTCHSVEVTIMLQQGMLTEQTTHRFAMPTTASQMLEAIAPSFAGQCQQVDLQLVASSEAFKPAYQHWVQQRTTSSSALAGARNFSLS